MSWLRPRRATEATADQLASSGAAAGWSYDPIDSDLGYRPASGTGRSGGRPVPSWTLERARTFSVHAYRANPMGRAIIDTYVAFVCGDSGLSLSCQDDEVRQYAESFWTDPAVNMPALASELCRDHLIMGETVLEMLVGPTTGVTRVSPVEPDLVQSVELLRGNPLWPERLVFRKGLPDLQVVRYDDLEQRLAGEAMFWPSFKALTTDRRGYPFLGPVLDWIDSYDNVLSNLIDRTALARYFVWDVTVQGGQKEVDDFVAGRKGLHAPRSGSVEVHNDAVEWNAKSAQTGSYEDVNTSKAILTLIAGGTGLAKTWLADPEDANRATALTMAEPVRRRVGAVQNRWLAMTTLLVRYAIDQRVRANVLPPMVTVRDAGGEREVPTSSTVSVTGPAVAAADAQITAQVMQNLSVGLQGMVAGGLLTREAAREASRRAWEDFMGVPYRHELDEGLADGDGLDDVAQQVSDAGGGSGPLAGLLKGM